MIESLTNKRWSWIGWTAAFATLAYIVLRLSLIRYRYFNVDEMEHMHAAWCMAHGMVPFRDFFEHHGPLWFLMVAPIPRFFIEPVHALWAGRGFMFLFCGLTAVMQWKLGDMDWPPWKRMFMLLLLFSFSTWTLHGIETRPDVPAMAFISVILWLERSRPSWQKYVVLGLLFGATLLTSPKALFVLFGIALGAMLKRSSSAETSHVVRNDIFLFTGFAIPFAIIGSLLTRFSAWDAFVHYFIIFNLHFHSDYPRFYGILRSLRENPIFWGLVIFQIFRGPKVLGSVRWTGLFWGLVPVFFMKADPFGQYFLLITPLLVYAASSGFFEIYSVLLAKKNRFSNPLFMGLAAMGIVYGFYAEIRELRNSNQSQINQIHIVMENTKETDKVLSIYWPYGFFRPHACFYCWLTPDIQLTLGARLVDVLVLTALTDPDCKGFIWQNDFCNKHPLIFSYVASHFHRVDSSSLYLKNQ